MPSAAPSAGASGDDDSGGGELDAGTTIEGKSDDGRNDSEGEEDEVGSAWIMLLERNEGSSGGEGMDGGCCVGGRAGGRTKPGGGEPERGSSKGGTNGRVGR